MVPSEADLVADLVKLLLAMRWAWQKLNKRGVSLN